MPMDLHPMLKTGMIYIGATVGVLPDKSSTGNTVTCNAIGVRGEDGTVAGVQTATDEQLVELKVALMKTYDFVDSEQSRRFVLKHGGTMPTFD